MNKNTKSNIIHLALFVATLITTTMAGAEWTYGRSVIMDDYGWRDFTGGFAYSLSFLFILTAHEFGHYFTAIYHKVKTTLPYYIPLPPIPFFFGTLGAVIRIKSLVPSKQQHFDIGIAGPLAGFVAALGVLYYGFTHLPPPEYIFQIHPEYEQFGLDYAQYVYTPQYMQPGTVDVKLGNNLIFMFFSKFVGDPARVPNMHEIHHFPLLFAGYLSLIFTCLNLVPIGQLDGGHVLYGLVGFKWHRIIASVLFVLFLFYAALGLVSPGEASDELLWKIPLTIGFLYLCLTGLKLHWRNTLLLAVLMFTVQYMIATIRPGVEGYPGWLLFAFIIGRVAGVLHPPSPIEAPLSTGRKILGWIALLIFILCFTPDPLNISTLEEVVAEGNTVTS